MPTDHSQNATSQDTHFGFRTVPLAEKQALVDGNKEAAAVLGFSGAIGAYGGFFIPKSFGTSLEMTGSVDTALYAFVAFYVSCIVLTWWFYARKGAEMPC